MVCSSAIYQMVVSAAKRDDNLIRVIAVDYQCANQFSLEHQLSLPNKMWANYNGVIHFTTSQIFQLWILPLQVMCLKGWLKLFFTLEVAIGQTVKTLYQLPISQKKLPLTVKSRKPICGYNCGIMDHISNVVKRAMHYY